MKQNSFDFIATKAMAIVIPRKNLSHKEQDFIVNMLTIKPKLPEKNFFSKGFKMQFSQTEPEPFPFFQVDENNVKVPYAFGSIFLKCHPHDNRDYHKINVSFTGELRDRQKKRVTKLDQHFEKHRTATLTAHTGFGKTRLSNYYIAKWGLLTVVLVPGEVLMNQWPKAIQDALPGVKVGVVGEDYREDLLDPEDIWKNHPDVLICMPDRWKHIPAEVRSRIGFLIIDEAHMFCAPKRSICLLQFEPKYILAMTASPRRRDGTIEVIHSLCGLHQVKARYPNKVTVWSFLTGLSYTSEKDARGNTNWSGTVKKITEDDERNNLIADLAVYLINDLKRKPLLMCDRKEHVIALDQLLKDRGVTCDYLMGTKSVYQDGQCLIAIMTKAGTGFDEQYACPEFNGLRIDTVVYCASFKEVNNLIQYGGRAFRSESPLIIHLIDDNSIIRNHWVSNSKYYKSGEYLKNVEIISLWSDDIWKTSA